MIAGDTQLIKLQADSQTPYTLSPTDITITGLQPDGTPLATPTQVTVTPSTSSATQSVTALLNFPQAGRYLVNWTLHQGGQTVTQSEQYFAAWTNPYRTARNALQRTTDNLPDADLDLHFAEIAQQITDKFPCLQPGGYSGLTGLDKERFDTALGLFAAVRLINRIGASVATGAITAVKLNQDSYEFATPQRPQASPNEYNDWLSEAKFAIGKISCINAYYAGQASSAKIFVVAGPTRDARNNGRADAYINELIRTIVPDPVY